MVETASPTTSYLTTDHLGSPRVVTDADGEVIARRDFMPFGEDLGAGVGPRTENLKYSAFGSDRVRQRFTGYEKDGETQLDFAEARMYQNKHGRFTAPDPLLASASAANPQTFNRYIYTGNNPVNITDPSGLNWCQNRQTNIATWVGSGNACDSDSFPITNVTTPIGAGGCFFGTTTGCYSDKSVVTFNGNGTTTLVSGSELPIPENSADEVTDTASQEIASASASELGTTMNQRPVSEVSLGCPVSVSSCNASSSSSSPGYQRLDTSRNEPLKTVELIARSYELCSGAPLIGSACAVGAAATRFGQGRFGDAGDNLLNVVPFLGIARKADKAVDTAKAADDVVEGIYEFVSSNGKVYVGQSSNIPARIRQHLASGKLLPEALDTVTSKTVLGGKTAREIAEQLRIRDLGGIKNLRNERNPIGRARKYLLEGL